MSRDLPERPSLDYLRKQAKMLLRELRRSDPLVRLTTAQHAIAREYGFASWRDLRSYVQRLSDQSGDVPIGVYAFQRYTPKARQALFFSRQEASEAGSTAIDPEHVLLGSIRAGQGLKGRIFERVGLLLDDARARIKTPRRAVEVLAYSVEIPFSGLTKQALLTATREADRLGHDGIGIVHLVLGLLGLQRSIANSLLVDSGVTAERVKADIADLLDEESGDR